MRSANSFTAPLQLLVCTGLFAWASLAIAEPPALPDQFGNTGGLNDFSGKPVLAIVSSRRKLRWIGEWEKALRPEIPQLNSIRIADITDQPRPNTDKVAEILRQRAPDTVSILIDLQNHWATAYELDTSEPCLILFDSDHKVVTKFRGRPKGELVNEVMTALRDYFPAQAES